MGVGASLHVRCRCKNVHVRYLIYWWVLVLHFGDSCNNAPLLILAKFGMRQYTHGLCWHAKFYLNVFIVSASGGQKRQIWTNSDVWGLLYRPPFTDEGQIWYAGGWANPWSTLTRQISSRSVYFVDVALWRRKPPNFTILLTSAFCGVASWQRSEKVEHGCTNTNLPLSIGIKIVSVLQRLHAEIVRTSSDIQNYYGQTNKKTHRFRRPSGGLNPSPTELGLAWW